MTLAKTFCTLGDYDSASNFNDTWLRGDNVGSVHIHFCVTTGPPVEVMLCCRPHQFNFEKENDDEV